MYDSTFHEQNIEDRRHARYALVLYLPPELDAIIGPHREKYDPLYNLIASHVTIVFPFDSAEPLDGIAGKIAEELKNEPAIPVSLSSIIDFYPTTPVICWKVAPNEQLSALYYRTYARLGLSLPFRDYIPHVTIAREISDHRVLMIKEQIVPYLPDEKFVAGSVDLITPLPGGRWVSVRTFRLEDH